MSSISNAEYVVLKATLHALDNQELICANCVTRYGDNKGALANFQTARGCEQPVEPPHLILEDGRISFNRCAGNFFDKPLLSWIQAADRYAQGTMPFSGGFFEQPAKAIELFGILLNWRAKQQEEQVKAHHSRMEAKRRGR